ncbi:MAG: efflux RND transporter periplasmic adaptor subunit [bacterium]|nr:efflux RND transporter periplasmic adaptor subunit [bacterium]
MTQSKSRLVGWLVLIVVISIALYLYFGLIHNKDTQNSQPPAAKEVYTCPMHPEIIRDNPGDCPICGMKLVIMKTADSTVTNPSSQPESKSAESNEAVKYQCPMHPAIIRDQPGDCPICGMKLVQMKSTSQNQGTSHPSDPKRIAFYRSPMDPKQTSPTPRKDEMGMDYIPVYEEEASGGGGNVSNRVEVTIDPSRQQLIGLRTATVMHSDISSDWRTVGVVQINPTKVTKTNVKVFGYVEKVFADFVGKSVRRGEPLFTYYSPDLLAAQQDYLLAHKASRSGGVDASNDSLMLSVVRQKLMLWDVSQVDIIRLEQTGAATRALTIVSPVTGVVTAKNIVAGSSMNPGDAAYEITDLNSVWVLADAYQSDAANIKIGMSATITLQSLPHRIFKGTVAFVDPLLDPQSRTFKVRINVDNSSGELKPEMFADIELQSSGHDALTIPADAIIPSGRTNMVFVALSEGKFQPRAVKLGEKSGDRVEVIEGLSEGENVVTRANFLIDSESSLRSALAAVGGN